MKLFGFLSKKVDINKLIDKSASGIDKLFYTKEEKADYNKQLGDSLIEFTKNSMSENCERSQFRRAVGNKIINFYLLLVVVAVVCNFTFTEQVEFICLLLDKLNFAFGSVIVFLFGGYYVDKFKVHKK